MNETTIVGDAQAVETRWHRFWRRIMTPPLPREDMTPGQRLYDTLSAIPMYLAAILWMLSLFFTWVPKLHEQYAQTGFVLSVSTWCIFLLDMVIRLLLDPHKENFFKRNWPLLIALLFPPLRVMLVGSAVMRIRRDRNALAKMVGLYAVYAVAFVVVFGAAFTLVFEIGEPGSSIDSYGDAVWWGFETVTTVGYGDFTPVTVAGRVVAVLIMFTGAAAVGAVTAAVASRFINTSPPAPAPTTGTDLDDIRRQLTALEAQIAQIAAAVTPQRQQD